MSGKHDRNTLPKWCHTILPQEGSLVIITYGEPGYKISPWNSGDREENRRIADRENRKIGRITLQQEKTMLTGALLGWKPLAGMGQVSTENEPWSVLIVKEDVDGNTNGSVVEMPATQYEIFDALDRSFVPAEEKIMDIEISEGGLPCLDERINPHTDIFELNYFIQKYFDLSEHEKKCFQGQIDMELQLMEKEQKIPIERLINLTGSAEDCELLEDVDTDYQLGKYCVENGKVKALENMPEILFDILDYESIGRKERLSKNGIFTENGYMTQNEYVRDIYSDKAISKEKPDYMIQLRVCHEKGKPAVINLPTDEMAVANAFLQLGLDNYEELEDCEFSVIDCIIPWTKEQMNDELYQTDCFGKINEFAKQLAKLVRKGELLTCKAILEETPADVILDEIIDLSSQTDKFMLEKSMKSPAEYAVESLAEKGVDINETLIGKEQLMKYGESVIAEKGIVLTEYGDLISQTGETVIGCMGREQQGMQQLL